MKKLLIIILLLFTHVFYAQVSDVKTVRIANATATFAENIPAGTQVYNVATGELWVANTAVISTLTLTTGSASFDLVGATPDGYTINDGTSSGGNFDVQISGTSGTYPTILQLDQTAAFGGQVTLGVGGALMKMYANPETITFEGSGGIVTEGRIAINNGSFNGQIFSTNLTATRNYELPNAAGVFAIEADASGFDGNLTNTDNTLQEIAQKFDDIVIPIDTNLAIATTGEIDTGTVDNKAMSPLGFAGSQYAIDITVNNAKVSATTATKYIYVSSYSIDDTGATSSSQAIQDALDAATGADNVVVFPSTATLLAKNLTIKPNTKIIADGTVFNFGGSSPSGYSANSDNSQQGIFHAYGTNISTMLTNIEIQGGEYNGERGATDWSTYAERDAFQFMDWRDGTVAGVQARVFRISFTGELTYEVNVPAHYGHHIWEQLIAAGEEFDITPYGTETMHVLRAEKGFIIVGQDTDGSMTPGDMNMDWVVGKTKHFSFLGERSLARSDTARSMRKQLVGLKPQQSTAVIPEGAQIVNDPAEPIPMKMQGHVTSSYYSANLGHSFALAVVKGGLSRMGDTVYCPLADGSTIAAEIVSSVFLDPAGDRQNV